MMPVVISLLPFVFFIGLVWFAARVWRIPQVNSRAHWHIVAALLGSFALDWLLLALLPRLGLSFGPVGPPLVALMLLRWLIIVLLAIPWRRLRAPTPKAVSVALTVMWLLNVILSLCAFEALYIEPFRLTVTEMAVDGPAFLPDRPLRIVQLSDLHVERTTRRERDVLGLMVEGLTNAEIAERLVVSLSTVKTHVSSIIAKLGASTRTEAATIAVREHLA